MGLFNWKQKQSIPKPSIFEALEIDLKKYPDESFILDTRNQNNEKVICRKFFEDQKLVNIFTEIEVITFPNKGNKNYILKCPPAFLEKYAVPELVLKLVKYYGCDDSNEGSFMRKDMEAIEEGFWMGRTWASEKFMPNPCALSYYEEDAGLSLTIWD